MNSKDIRPTGPTNNSAGPRPRSRVLIRVTVTGIVSLLTIAALAVGIPWGWYRLGHVVLNEATVKGTVTKIGARIEGRIKSIEVAAGQEVKKDDVLLRMEDSHLQAALTRARAELQSAQKELTGEKMGVEQTRKRLSLEIERVNAMRKKSTGELDAATSNLEKLGKQYDRIATLIKTGAAATSEMDRITGDRDRALGLVTAASGVLEAAEFSHQKALNELDGVRVREARLEVLDSQVAVAQGRIATAEADLDATVIRAPEAGRILERIVEVGGSAKVGEPMISLWFGRAWVEAWVDERDLRKFLIGSPVDVSLDASPQSKLAGRVEAIGLVTDKQLQPNAVPTTLHSFVRQNAMVPLRIALEQDNSQIQLGLSVLVGIKKEAKTADPAGSQNPSPVPLANSLNHLTRVNSAK